MCWKYEEQYHNCFDPMFFSYPQVFDQVDAGNGETISVLRPGLNDSLVDFLRDSYDIKVVDESSFGDMVFGLLSKMHEQGVIVPSEEQESGTKNSKSID